MDGTSIPPLPVMALDGAAVADGPSPLAQVLGNLEQNAAILESLELTLALALLDHAIEEVRRHLAGQA
jgi:hypothetical protein